MNYLQIFFTNKQHKGYYRITPNFGRALNNISFHTEYDNKQNLSNKIVRLNMPSAPLVLTMSTTRAKHQHIGWIWIGRYIMILKEPYQTRSQSLIWLFFLYQHDQSLITPIVGLIFFSYKTDNSPITFLRSVTTDSGEKSRGEALDQRHTCLFALSSHFFWPDTCLYLTNMRLVQHYHTKTALSDTATNT